MTVKKKLIEVALPLEAINKASAREKSIRHGHPSTLHLWWARRPLAAARAVIFAQMVDDPSSVPDLFPTEKKQQKERERLFRIIEDFVQWENTTNESMLERARAEIWQSWRRACAEHAGDSRAKELFDRNRLPVFLDPFAGGGALPLEAQRLGLTSYASDLNPVAVLICKAMIEIPPKFAGQPPVSPTARKDKALIEREWRGAQGLAEDVRSYGIWMREEAERRIGHLYPSVEVTAKMATERPDLQAYVGHKLKVIAWLWARTVKSPNPAFAHVDVPLASTFMLFNKPGKEAFVEPVIKADGYRFMVRMGTSKEPEATVRGTSAGKRKAFVCLMSGVPITYEYIRSEGKASRIGTRLMAVVAEGERGRVYLSPTPEMEVVALQAKPEWRPDCEMPKKHRNFQAPVYGMNNLGDLFTPRQLVALTTFSDLVQDARERAKNDAVVAGLPDDGYGLAAGGTGASAYADAVAVYLTFNVSKLSDLNNNLVTWKLDRGCPVHLFARQAIPMVWDFPEANPFSESSGSWESALWHLMTSMTDVCLPAIGTGHLAAQADASTSNLSVDRVISTDPPYYDNIGYADLSDFFYVWLRRSLRPVFPELFATVAVPKAEELIAAPHRHGGKEQAETFFLERMTHAMHRLAEQGHPAFPVTIYYAFKQSETESDSGTASTGWETFLEAVIRAGFVIGGTWPMRTEMRQRMIGMDSNALASSIILVCRRRAANAPAATRRDFLAALKSELPASLIHLQRSNIAPVDLAQAAIGPGMAVYTRYSKVFDAGGQPLSVREALSLINQILDEVLAEQEGDFDADSRFALAWFEQQGFSEGDFDDATKYARAKNTGMNGLVDAGIIESKRGKVRLLKPSELPADWDPATDGRLTHWETVHHLIRVIEARGEGAAARLVAKLGSKAETARELAYRLYTICERKKRAAEALSYNGLVQSWPEITRLAREGGKPQPQQAQLFEQE